MHLALTSNCDFRDYSLRLDFGLIWSISFIIWCLTRVTLTQVHLVAFPGAFSHVRLSLEFQVLSIAGKHEVFQTFTVSSV